MSGSATARSRSMEGFRRNARLVITLGEQRTFQRNGRNSLIGEEAQYVFQVPKHPLMAGPALDQNAVAPGAFRRGDVRTSSVGHQSRHAVTAGVFLILSRMSRPGEPRGPAGRRAAG